MSLVNAVCLLLVHDALLLFTSVCSALKDTSAVSGKESGAGIASQQTRTRDSWLGSSTIYPVGRQLSLVRK